MSDCVMIRMRVTVRVRARVRVRVKWVASTTFCVDDDGKLCAFG